jgi:hypothetical protein
VALIVIPKQHGAWSILIASFILGASLGGKFGVESVLLLLAVLSAFLGRYTASEYLKLPVSDAARKNLFVPLGGLALFLAIFLLGATLLVIKYSRWFLIPLGIVSFAITALSLYLAKKGKDLTLSGEIINMLGLSLVAPAAEYTSRGIYSLRTFGLWLLGSFFFAGSAFRVRYFTRKRLEAGGEFRERLKAGMSSLIFHIAAFLITFGLTRNNVLPSLAPLTLAPINLRVLWSVGRRYKNPIPIRAIGYIELFHTLVFLALVMTAYLPLERRK